MTFNVKILPSNLEFTVKAEQTVLDAALDAGIVLPYSCRSGTCSTCKGRIVQGDWDAGTAPEQIIEADQLAQGYTLLCQAHPKSDLVIEAQVVRMAGDIEVRKMPGRIMSISDTSAPDIRIISLQLPASQPMHYMAGQYIEFIMRDGRRRSYSMANVFSDSNLVELHIRHMPGGAFTDHVFGAGETHMKEREIQRVEGPFGSSFLREDSAKPILFLASGTGFAPIKAMMERLIETGSTRSVVLYWGCRRPHDLYMHSLVQEWAATLANFSYVPVVSEATPEDKWQGRTGFVHEAVMHDIPNLADYQVYACGTPVMVHAAQRDFVKHNNLPETEFFADAFTSEADTLAKSGI